MILILLMFLCLPLAILFSFLASFPVLKQNRPLGSLLLITSLLSALSILWELRFDIDIISHMFTYDQLSADFQAYFMALYLATATLSLLARLRWNRDHGRGILLILAITFWVLSPAPHVLISPGAFMH
ncbi:hypothetical protein [Parasedimentitalea huanghaiensis]|uniref:Uncharacterized protein n=1 Tax=Parasedimentitalea huanghaiensis TaxID=2682100 RepID=A0A6L6WF47_9RHOB|nr:hypothetical protein [Zongyanglinia huanghaiensis]MVO15908.1 hypothetical protein [Zongyanglinia huanghaiensis]